MLIRTASGPKYMSCKDLHELKYSLDTDAGKIFSVDALSDTETAFQGHCN